MKRKIEIIHRTRTAEEIEKTKTSEDFYRRWYAKFGEPQTRTMPANEFLSRLKEMIDFE